MYATLREKIAAEKIERANRYALFVRIIADADDAGMNAAAAKVPRPMMVGTATSLFGSEIDTSQPVYQVNDGVCGFAWVTLTNGRSSFALWAKKHSGFRKNYGGGVQLWVSDFNQSMEKKEAYARAFAGVLNEHAALTGCEAYMGSRMD